MGATEEFFHVARIAARLFGIVLDTFLELDGTDGAEGAFVAEDKIDGFVVDEAVSGVAILGADLVAKKSGEADLGNDVEFLAKESIEHLETLTFGTNHQVFAGTILEAVHGLFLAALGGDTN